MLPVDDAELDEDTYPSLSHSPVKEELGSSVFSHATAEGRRPKGDHGAEVEVPLSLSTCKPMQELKKLTS